MQKRFNWKRAKAVTDSPSKFRNVILCEDIRDEIGNKKSLMGVMAGDVLVSSFPATFQIAIYMEYQIGATDERRLSIELRLLQDDAEIVKGGMDANIPPGNSTTFVLPRALMTVEREATLKIRVSVNKGPEEEILSKKISKTPTTS